MNCSLVSPVVKRITFQSLLCIGLSISLGFFGMDRARMDSNLFTSSMEITKPIPRVSIEEMNVLLKNKTAVCIDARSHSDYRKGHIQGAISMPVSNFDESLSKHLEFLSTNQSMVIYCGGEGCDLSEMLARKLMALGIDQVSIFSAGWSAWKKAGLQIEL